ncbi:MAG: glycosyltransferase family 39 protein [Anaerolineae bacterium]
MKIERWAIIVILLLAAALRCVDLERVPPPFNVDEAVNAYDAYSLLTTGRDQWGNPWPVTFRAFNDYRRPATIYTAMPFLAVFGLTIYGIRAVAAFWGWMTVLFTYRLARDLFGRRVGVGAALLLALSPWHIAFSRLGVEVSGPLLFTLVVGLDCGWRWRRSRRPAWLIAAAVAFGLSFYTYTTAQAFTPLLLLAVAVIFRRELWQQRRVALLAAALMILIAAPLAFTILRTADSWNRMNAISVFADPNARGWRTVLAQWVGHFAPGYLFLRGDAQPVHHAPGFGQLYWIEMALIPLGLLGLLRCRDRRAVFLLLAWIALGPIPAALTRQDMGTANSMRGIAGLPGWAILSGLGLALPWKLPNPLKSVQSVDKLRPALAGVLLGALPWKLPNPLKSVQSVDRLRPALAGVLLGALAWNAGLVLHNYFTVFPVAHARDFEYGIREAMDYVLAHEDDYDVIVLTDWISQPHIFAVFFQQYPPRLFQANHAPYGTQLSEKLQWWGTKYRTGNVDELYAQLEHGLFVARPHMLPDVEPVLIIEHPNGTPAFKIIVK